jgi:hypothetical protein
VGGEEPHDAAIRPQRALGEAVLARVLARVEELVDYELEERVGALCAEAGNNVRMKAFKKVVKMCG